MEQSRGRGVNSWIAKLNQAIGKTGDDIILSAAFQHLKVFEDFLSKDEVKDEIMSGEEVNNVLVSKLFYDKMHILMPKKRFTCRVEENSGCMIPLLPIELFGKIKCNEDFKREIFSKCLKRGDILYCRVTSVQGINYLLKVIYKYGALSFLDDLNVTVMLPADTNEISQLPGELHKCDILRVAVRDIQPGSEIKVIVTLNDSVMPFKKTMLKLGKISEEDLPPYVLDLPDVSHFKSYVGYLNSFRGFQNHLAFQELTPKFGIDPCRLYSFFPKFESLHCPDEFSGGKLLKKTKESEVAELLDAAAKAYEEQQCNLAFHKIKSALEIDENCYNAYILRSRIFADIDKPKFSRRAIINLEKAYSLDPSNFVKEQLSHTLYAVGFMYYKKKQYQEASQYAEKALNLNPNNSLASELYEYLKLKHLGAFLDLEAVSLHELQAKKKKIVTQLKEIDTSDVPKIKKEKLEVM